MKRLYHVEGDAHRSVATERFVAVICADTPEQAMEFAVQEPRRGCDPRGARVREIGTPIDGTPPGIVVVAK